MTPCIKLPSGLVIVAEVRTHAEVLIRAQRDGIDPDQIIAKGWIDLDSYRETPDAVWPGLTAALQGSKTEPNETHERYID